jgi:hypothetical protein
MGNTQVSTAATFLPVWGWVFDFCNTHQFWALEKKIRIKESHRLFQVFENSQNQRTAGSGYFAKTIRFKEPLVLVLCRKNQTQRTGGSGYLTNSKESSGFVKEPAKTGHF